MTLENMDQGLMMINSDGSIPVWNSRALELLDLPPELMQDENAFKAIVLHQHNMDEFATSDPKLRPLFIWDRIDLVARTYERSRPNGIVLEVRTVPLAEGGAVRTYTDVTAGRAAEAALAKSEALYRLLGENATDMIGRTSLDGVRRYVSPAARDVLGYEPEELIGLHTADLVHPDDRTLHNESWVSWFEARSITRSPSAASGTSRAIGSRPRFGSSWCVIGRPMSRAN